MLALEMGTERACAKAIAVLQVGIEGDPPRLSDGRVVTNSELHRTKKDSFAATVDGRAATLRAKQRRVRSPAEGHWRTAMASAFMLTIGARDPKSATPVIIQRAEAVGEGEFARRIMLPMLAAKFSLP